MRNIQYISASAGSGKTYTLTHKLADAVRGYSVDSDGNKTPVAKIEPEQVILTTYTKKAAAEFREKAKAALHESGLHDEAVRLDQAMIGTVHSVADSFIHKYWYRLGISPELNVMTDDDRAFFINQSLAHLPSDDELKFLNKFCRMFSICYGHDSGRYGLNYEYWKNDLKRIVDYTTNFGINDYAESLECSENVIKSLCREGAHVCFNKEKAESVLAMLCKAVKAGRQSGETEKRLGKIEEFRRKLNDMSYSDMASLRDFINKRLSKALMLPEAIEFAATLDDIWVSEEVRDAQLRYVRLLFKYAGRWREMFAAYKRGKHLVDYNDMEALFLKLLGMPGVAEDIREEYKYLLVDEFQDSSPIQVRIFDRLSDIVDRSVWVGDYKQAIYGFRGADTELVKAVTGIIAKNENGCSTDTLGICYRSCQEIVDVCNKVFVPAFSDILPKEQVELKPHRKSNDREHNLRVWPLKGKNIKERNELLARNIAYEIKHGKKPEEIAVLAMKNNKLDDLAEELRTYGIPVCRDNSNASADNETLLLTSLLSLLLYPEDELSRAQIALLTVKDCDTAEIIDEKLTLKKDSDNSDNIARKTMRKNVNTAGGKGNTDKPERFLDNIPLVNELIEKADMFRLQSVKAVVESIVVELDLYNVVAHWDNPRQSRAELHSIVEAAAEYEDHCLQMTLPATVSGFIDYINDNGVTAHGDPDGVRLFTYHSAKGLEWDTVVLLSLDDNPIDVNKLLTNNFFGVQAFHNIKPSPDNLYPPMTITVLPWIYNKSVPDEIKSIAIESERFRNICEQVLSESKRLLYVAMTRAVKELILAPSTEKNGMALFNCIYAGKDLMTGNYKNFGSCDVLGVGVQFLSEAKSDAELDNNEWQYATADNIIIDIKGKPCREPERDVQPSGTNGSNAKIEVALESDSRLISICGRPDMAVVGSCIHDIFCSLDRNKTVGFVENIIKGYELAKSLKEPSHIIEAWNRLESFLIDNFGIAERRFHELPFKQLNDGCIVTGSMDLVWKTTGGCVLIDYKTFPGNEQLVITPGDHYAGNYKGQFDCYTNALRAACENVLARFVYYPVTGMLVRI